MDWSAVGREAKRVVKDVIDQSFGTHFFSSGKKTGYEGTTAPTQTPAEQSAESNSTPPQQDTTALKETDEEAVKKLAQAQQVQAELEQAIALQRQKREAEEAAVEKIRQESLEKSGLQVREGRSTVQSDTSKNSEKLDSQVVE